ncbi:zinc finger FYVE domain-containing protein 26 homolog [Episyrphus balteatus]|uniref:zinc finger FYVE domain-containing protein 26 homolog n=1 Tax=Episyrphus balteatus TaxID=286459 RepID=UPI0024868DE7|nr:zinc finger FYVE domain-containing protein 26 homolog [Episyrphus balteatus]
MENNTIEFYLSILERDTAFLFENFIKDFHSYNRNYDLQTSLAKCILRKPFPTIKILDTVLKQHPDSRDLVNHIKRLAVQIFFESTPDDDRELKFINLLVNLEQPEPILKQKSDNIIELGRKIGDHFYMGLLANSNLDFLLYPAFSKQSIDYFAKEVILCETLKNEAHFVTLAIQKQKNFADITTDSYMRNALILAKVSNEFNSLNQSIDEVGNLKKMLELYDCQEASEIQNIFFNDFRRLGNNIEFLRKYNSSIIPIGTLIETNGILPLIYDHKNIILVGYDEIRQVIESNHTFESQSNVLPSMRDSELETLTYFFVLAGVYDVIINRSKIYEQFYEFAQEKISRLKVIIRQIRNIDVLCNLMEDIFQLVFLRWEHLDSPTASRQFDKKKSTSSTDAAETRAEGVLCGAGGRHGFICQGAALKFIFSFLKHFITQKLHSEEYKICSERIKLRFTRVMDCINDGLWKYSVLEKISDTEVESFQLEAEDLLQLVQLHRENIEKTSSEDESKERINYASLSRRKAKKRRRATFGGGEQQRIGVGVPQRKDIIKNNGNVGVPLTDITNRKSIIPNMLTTPENLAIMALAMKNFNDVKYIIQTFNLQNTELNRELKFVENQQHTKRKLESIYESYLQQEIQTKDPQATVERIKKAAAKGFEASKIISIVDNFANANTFECSDEIQTLLEKYSHSYPFLQHYQGPNVRAVIAADLILNLNTNYDIIANIVPVIRRMCKLPKISSSLSVNSGLPSEMGCLNFLDNICECMRLIKSYNRPDIGLKDLLCNSFYSLKPKKLSIELQRDKIFQNIFSKSDGDLQRIDDLKALANDFADLKTKFNYFTRFLSYIGHLSKFLQIRDKQAEFFTTALLRFDPSDIIGELIFEENMTPLEIESHVVALNLNLIHVIALNICPEICGKERKPSRHSRITKEKYQSIFNYISNQNALLGYILQKIQDSSQTYCSTMMNDEYLHRFIQFESVACLSKIYDDSSVIAGILSHNIDRVRMRKLKKKVEIYDILQNCQEQARDREAHLSEKDKVIIDLIAEDTKYVYLASDIENINTRSSLIFKNFTRVPSSCLAKDLIESTLLHWNAKNIDKELRSNLERTLLDISIYSEVSSVLEFESWPQAYDFGLKTPNIILQKLLSQGHFKLCYDWCCVVQLSISFDHQIKSFFATFLEILVQLEDDFDRHIVQTIETFPQLEVCQFYDANKHKFRSVNLLNYVIDFLNNNIKNTTHLRNYKVSLKIFEQLTPMERDQNWNLLSKPLLIVEQLIMNVKFKEVASILDAIRPLLEDNQSNCLTVGGLCKYCFDKRGNIYDIHSKKSTNFTLGNESSSAFILLNFNLYQKDHIITLECVDLLLRIYATKALDYQIREFPASSSERVSQSTDMASLDSLCGAFVMPHNAPGRDQWVQDDEAAHCMCCRRAVFTMLMRRHHCRRCGRVVCFACSTNRMQIPEIYEDVAVRVCNDCVKQTQEHDAKTNANKSSNAISAEKKYKFSGYGEGDPRWKLSGNITHDKLLREEFCYEHAPSVALCLSILSYHSDNRKCVDLLLFHCGKLEKLLVPNPEVDYELIAKMMNCLALAAKVRGGPPEVETIREHSDIIMSVVQNGCEALIPAGPLNNQNLRKLADSLVQVEKWQLALEIHWKCGFPTAGVMAAHGLACLRAGSFETAKEKLSHCMTKHSSEQENSTIIKIISNDAEFVDLNKKIDIPTIKRPNRSPPLLHEVLKIIESIPCSKLQPETLARASIIRNSNTSLASLVSKRRDNIPLHEPAINILNTLANLKQLAKGQYTDNTALNSLDNKRQILRQSRVFEECLHYVITYGSHSDIVDFFIRHKELSTALKYFVIQGQDVELFIHHIFLGFLRTGSVGELIQAMIDIDEHLGIWKEAILGTCRFLETKNLLNCLYELQIILKDPVRASMTCVKFYSMNCQNFKQLHANALHLQNAHRHLQSELEMSQWERINVDQRNKQQQTKFNSILMQMDAKSLNAHINTLLRQMDVAKFLAQCEEEQPMENGMLLTEHILKQIRIDTQSLPTLFDSPQEKIQICILILLSGKNIEEGFGLAYRIIQNYKLPIMKVFGATAKYLARNGRLEETERLLNCIIGNNGTTNREIDEILSIAINSATNNHQPEVKTALDSLAKKINSLELRISSYIFIGQLKSAYLLAIQHNRLNDIRKILHQAEATNQVHIKKLCEKKLSMSK